MKCNFLNKIKKISSPCLVSVVHLAYFVVLGGGGGGVQLRLKALKAVTSYSIHVHKSLIFDRFLHEFSMPVV